VPVLDPIQQFYTKFSRYPGNNKQWWIARADADDPDAVPPVIQGDFKPELLDKLFSGNNHAPRGHFILDVFNKDRGLVSKHTGIPIETTKERPNTITFYAGRVWYGCNSTVYFSQLLTGVYKAGLCLQEADPTAEDISDLIATDGGVIPIPEITKIIRLVPHQDGVIVFATNGVWQINGGQNGFTALDISVNKVSPIGCKSPLSIVETEEGVFWWSDVGIMGMTQRAGVYGPIPGSFDRTNISESTIQTFFNEIDENIKHEVKGVFDARNNRVLWLYRDDDVSATQYNRVLIFDIALGAFYPWKFSNLSSNTPYIKGLYVSERLTFGEDDAVNRYPSTVEYFAIQGGEGRFAQVTNSTFVDWEAADGEGATYESFIETGYELFNDSMKRKNITYLFTYLRKTEESIVEDELIGASSCYMTIKWDWSDDPISNKWTDPIQIYKPGPRFLPLSGTGELNTGSPVVITKNKVRGNGKAIQFRYGTDERARNFDLHGWSIVVTGETIP
jgi:hypothetical protein